jgi:hypothetical protein
MTIFKNFKTACEHHKFPGSHQVGSYGPKDRGIVRSYSNGTPGKDIITLAKKGEKTQVLYRLKDEAYRKKFQQNIDQKRKVRFFRKLEDGRGVQDLGMFDVVSFTDSGHVKMTQADDETQADA